MDLDFEDVLGAELPFVRSNPGEVEVIELNANGEVVDVVATDPAYLGELADDYYLVPTIDPVTDNMPFEMEELGAMFRIGGTIGTGIRGTTSATTSGTTRTTASITAARKRRAAAIAAAKKKAAALAAAKLKVPVKPKVTIRRPKASFVGARRTATAIVPGLVASKPSAVAIHKAYHAAKPQIIAKPKLATAGVTCGCAGLGRIETMLKKAATQRTATSEHNTIINQQTFRRKTIGQLRAILGRLSDSDRSKVIKAACGMG